MTNMHGYIRNEKLLLSPEEQLKLKRSDNMNKGVKTCIGPKQGP